MVKPSCDEPFFSLRASVFTAFRGDAPSKQLEENPVSKKIHLYLEVMTQKRGFKEALEVKSKVAFLFFSTQNDTRMPAQAHTRRSDVPAPV